MSTEAVSRVADLKGDLSDYVMQPKVDGFRIIAVVHEDRVDFMTRGEKWIGERQGDLKHIENELRHMVPPGTVLDGEVVALNDPDDPKRNDFEWVQGAMLSLPERSRQLQASRPLSYMVFDVLQIGENDLRSQPLAFRLQALDMVFHDSARFPLMKHDHVLRIYEYPVTQAAHDELVAQGWEGSVVKRLDSPYVHNKSRGWYKIKATWTMDAIIVGFIRGEGKYSDTIGSIVFAQPTPDEATRQLSEAYKKELAPRLTAVTEEFSASAMSVRGSSSGMDDTTRYAIGSHQTDYIGRVVEISHNGLMAGGLKVRHPQFLRFRDPSDKPASAVDWRHR